MPVSVCVCVCVCVCLCVCVCVSYWNIDAYLVATQDGAASMSQRWCWLPSLVGIHSDGRPGQHSYTRHTVTPFI